MNKNVASTTHYDFLVITKTSLYKCFSLIFILSLVINDIIMHLQYDKTVFAFIKSEYNSVSLFQQTSSELFLLFLHPFTSYRYILKTGKES